MAVLPVGFGASGGYTIDRSLRFRSSASAYLSRTPASAGNRKTWTWSGWVKRGSLGVYSALFACNNAAGGGDEIGFTNADALQLGTNGGNQIWLVTSQVFRDPSAWYHIVASVDTTQATASNRAKLYVNGVQVTALGTATYPTQNADTTNFNTTSQHLLGGGYVSLDGYMTEVNFIDGQALDPTYFGEYNEDTGVWQPIKYTGTYGTNGFYLNFSDNTSTTTLGYDTSGNGNNWTANNISLTSGVTYDSMTDVPTLTSEDAANYCTLSPLDYVTAAPTSGNLKLTNGFARATMAIPSTGKWYWENTIGASTNNSCGLSPASSSVSDANGSTGFYAYYLSGAKYTAGNSSSYGASWTNGDVISVAVDADAGTVTFYKNNVSQGVAFTGLDFSSPWLPLARPITSATTDINFGQRPFAYTPPAGFKSLNTYNLTDSTIVDGSQYFDVLLETGTGSARNVTGLQFAPDFLWAKGRNASSSHLLYDTVRGVDKSLNTNNALDEDTTAGQLTSFNSNGYSLPNDTAGYLNLSGRTYAFWNWKANGSGVTNNEGTIESIVSANTTAGVSIVTYTGNATSGATVGHGVGVAPSMIILKSRTVATNWYVYHSRLTSDQYQLYLNLTSGEDATGITAFNDKAPTSSVFELPGSGYGSNNSGATYVAYCFAEVEGFSKFGSYTGNGSPDGPFSYLGFRPAFVMIKSTGVGTRWIIWDAARDTYNVADKTLAPNFNAEEFVNPPYWYVDLLSNGFKVRGYQSGDTENNYPSSTYIYMAFAENPFKNALAR